VDGDDTTEKKATLVGGDVESGRRANDVLPS